MENKNLTDIQKLRRVRGELNHAQYHSKKKDAIINALNQQLLEKKSSDDGFKVITDSVFGSPNETPLKSFPSNEDLATIGFAGNGTAHAVINKIAEMGAGIPWVVEKKVGDKWEAAPESALQKLIDKPQADKTAKEFRKEAMIWLLTTGNYILRKPESVLFKDDIKSVELLEPNLIKILTDAENNPTKYQYSKNNYGTENFDVQGIFHTKLLNTSLEAYTDHFGLSPLVPVWDIVKADNNAAKASGVMLKNRGVQGIISNGDTMQVMTEGERQNIQDATNGQLEGAENMGKVITTKNPITYTNIGFTPSDMQAVESSVTRVRAICTALSVPSSLFNDQAAATMDNMKVAEKKMYKDSVLPYNDYLIRPFEKHVLPEIAKAEGAEYRIVQDTSGIESLQEDQKEKVEKDVKMTDAAMRIVSANHPIEVQNVLLKRIGFNDDEIKLLVIEPVKPETNEGNNKEQQAGFGDKVNRRK